VVLAAIRWLGAVSSGPGAMILLTSSMVMQLRLDLAESPAPVAALWELVGSEQRRTAIALLAALIGQAVVGEGVLDDRASLRDPSALGGPGD
jgi:hypothetical protein